MNLDVLKKEFLPRYLKLGDEKFHNFLIFHGISILVKIQNNEYKGLSPDLQYLEYYSQFLVLYRREGNASYLVMAKNFRKAAHKLYRVMLKKKLTPINLKFLNLV